ncbi:hypothetical protein DXG01_012440 [Tephrocybe rancida]|nr:hypothetical protein DXG01_012440 [Tephrocybe rancida]
MSDYFYRAPTPPILCGPVVITNGNGNTDWYDDKSAGAYVLTFGRHQGQSLRETSLSYLYWCERNLQDSTQERHHAFLNAFEIFHAGLRDYAVSNPDRFRVPFGRKHQGEKLGDFHDPGWLLWTQEQTDLTNKYPVYFEAVQKYLEETYYQDAQDASELSEAETEYHDCVDLQGDAYPQAVYVLDDSEELASDEDTNHNVVPGLGGSNVDSDESDDDEIPGSAATTPPLTPVTALDNDEFTVNYHKEATVGASSSAIFAPKTPSRRKHTQSASPGKLPADREPRNKKRMWDTADVVLGRTKHESLDSVPVAGKVRCYAPHSKLH